MDVLKEMVRNLAAIIILTSFLEMLLPNTKMKGYTRLILGLFVIVIVLNPVLNFLDSGTGYSIQAWSYPSKNHELNAILEDAQEITAQSQRSIFNEYRSKVEQQIAALVRLSPEVSRADVEIKIGEGISLAEEGRIERVKIPAHVKDRDSAGKGESKHENSNSFELDSRYDPVKNRQQEREELRERIRSIVGDFFGLKLDQVDVQLEN